MINELPNEPTLEEDKVLKQLVERMGLEETLVYILYNINPKGKLQEKFSLSVYLILEMFERADLIKYLRDSMEIDNAPDESVEEDLDS
jgi:ribosomal protein S24E